MGARVPKQYLPLGHRPILALTLSAVCACARIQRIFCVVPPDDIDYCRKHILDPAGSRTPVQLVAGGRERQESVFLGLQAMEASTRADRMVVVHDGVRPFIAAKTIEQCIDVAADTGAAIAAVPVADTLKRAGQSAVVRETVDRGQLWHALTPQVFRFSLLMQAHRSASRTGFQGTDDAQLVEQLKTTVRLVAGSRWNLKITTADDFALAGVLVEHFFPEPGQAP